MHNYINSKWSLYLLPLLYILIPITFFVPFLMSESIFQFTVTRCRAAYLYLLFLSEGTCTASQQGDACYGRCSVCIFYLINNPMYCHSYIKLMNAFWASPTLMLLSYMAFLTCWCNNYNLLKLFHFTVSKAVAFQWTKWEEFLFILNFPNKIQYVFMFQILFAM